MGNARSSTKLRDNKTENNIFDLLLTQGWDIRKAIMKAVCSELLNIAEYTPVVPCFVNVWWHVLLSPPWHMDSMSASAVETLPWLLASGSSHNRDMFSLPMMLNWEKK